MSLPRELNLSKQDLLAEPYVTAGDRAYLIGAQNGTFPDLGWHVAGEMGGLWAHPIKLLDGFWLRVDDHWLTAAHRFVSTACGNAHEYTLPDGLEVTRSQFVPDAEPALVVRYAFSSPVDRLLRLRWLARSDLQPVWPVAAHDAERPADSARYLPSLGGWLCRSALQPWFILAGAVGLEPAGHESGATLWGPEETAGSGISVALDYELAVPAGGEAVLELVIAGSNGGEELAHETFCRVRDQADSLHQSKEARFEALLRQSELCIPEPSIVQTWDWVKCNYDWLIRDVPGVGRGLGAGLADYPWWFGCDSAYALLGCLVLGQHETAISTLDLLRALGQPGPGRVPHEANTRGQVVHPGCVQETPHFVTTAWRTFQWTGDLSFLRRTYEFCRRGVLEWVVGERCEDNDLLPCGYGIIEIEGFNLQCLDGATHTISALDSLAAMADLVGDGDVGRHCRELAAAGRGLLDEAFWLEDEGMYGDIRATPRELIPRLRTWMGRAASGGRQDAVTELERLLRLAETAPHPDHKRAWLCKNWTVIAPAEAGIAPAARARRLLPRVESPEFLGPWGMYVSPLVCDDMMSITTGGMAVAELAYGRVEQALRCIRLVAETLSLHMPGAISEISPDQGCFLQAWSGYAVAWPLVAQVFGLQPDAYNRRLVVDPCFPHDWQQASLRRVRVGSATFDLQWNGSVLTVKANEPGWTVVACQPAIPVEYVSPPVR